MPYFPRNCEGVMEWFGWILIVVVVVVPLALLCYSAVATGLELGRKVQPFVDFFLDFVATISGHPRRRSPRVWTADDHSRSEVPKTSATDR